MIPIVFFNHATAFYDTYNTYVYEKCESQWSGRSHSLEAPVTRYGDAAGNMCINLRRKRLHLMYFYLSPLRGRYVDRTVLPSRSRIRPSMYVYHSPRLRSVHHPVRLPPGEHVKSYYSDKLRRTDFRGPFSRRTRAMELSHTYTVIS